MQLFLAIVLVTGTITAISPSFIIKGVNAQAGPEYYEYNSYGPPEYSDNNNYNSYEPDFGMDNYDKKSYRNNDYESEYSSYGNDNYKSKDSSDIINKIKCTTNNINVNGDITGDVNLGNKGTAEGYSGAYSSNGDEGYDGERYYDNGYKKDKGFECIITNNNNNIINFDNETIPEPLTCEECFTENIINEVQLTNLTLTLSLFTIFGDLEGLCEFLSDPTFTNNEKIAQLSIIFSRTNIPEDIRLSIFECLDERGIIVFPADSRLSDLPTAPLLMH